MKKMITVLTIGTALVVATTTFAACDVKPTDVPISTTSAVVTTVTTERPTTTETMRITTTAKSTTTAKKQTTTTATPTTATTVATAKAPVTTQATTTVTSTPTATTTKALAVTASTPTMTTRKEVVTTATPTTTTTKKQTTTATPTTATTKKQTTTAKPTTTTTKKQTTTTKKTTTTTAPPISHEVTQQQMDRIRNRFLELVNQEREQNGVQPLVYHQHLNACAQIRSEEITECWSHTRPDGSEFQTVIDYDEYMYRTMGENLCMSTHFGGGYYDESYRWVGSDAQIEQAAQAIYNLFYNSSGHHANYMNGKFEDTGIGITYVMVDEGIPVFYLAQLFGSAIS